MSEGGPFSRTTLWVIVPVVIVSLVVAGALTLVGDGDSGVSAGADGYSTSAIGHRGLVELLGALDVPVIVSRNESAAKAKSGLLIIAEPGAVEPAKLEALVDGAPRVLVVLPKWYGRADRGEPWIDDADELPLSDVEQVLRALELDGDVRRTVAAATTWELPPDVARPDVREPQTIDTHAIDLFVSTNSGVFVGKVRRADGELWLLSDPDVLNNAGLRIPANAQFTVQLIDQLRAGGPVVLDETLHGHATPPSLVRTLFEFPLVLATIQVLACGLLAAWAAMVRFGPRRAAPPPIAPGKDFLIRNTAALLRYGGHHADALRRYLAVTIQDVRRASHAPDGLAPAALTAWLDRLGTTRGATVALPQLAADVAAADNNPQRVVELADQIYRWRLEMTAYGSRSRS